MNKNVERLYNGIIKENPTFVLMLGMCPTLAVTSSAINGLGMGLSTTVVLVLSNLLISAFRKVIPNGVRMPAYIVIVASLVTVVQFMTERCSGCVYSSDRCKLYHLRTCRKLCLQESGCSFYLRWTWYGTWIYTWPDTDRSVP